LGIGDVDGDLVPDFCAVLGRDAWLVSGRELRLLGGMEKLTGEVAPAHGDCTVGDLDGDRIPDFVLVIQQQEKPGTAKLAWYSGRDGRNLATVAYPGYAGRKERVLSWTLLPVDHGRARDLLLATCVDPTISTSRLVRLSGATGEFIQHMSAEHWPQIGARVEVWPEGERDGRPIYAASVSYPGLNEEQSFGVYVFEAGPPVQSLKPILASAVAGQER
jgi:hypothetical protein